MICPEDIEIWRPVPIEEYAGHYEVSSYGRVRRSAPGNRTRAGFLLKPDAGPFGHLRVTLSALDHKRRFWVHRLVLGAFVGPQPARLIGLHGNDDPRDNHYLNLRWDTHAANTEDIRKNGNMWNGTRSGRTHLTDANVIAIRARCRTGEVKAAIARAYGISPTVLWFIERRRTWRHLP